MRRYGVVVPAAALLLLAGPASAETATAYHFGVVHDEEGDAVRVAIACVGESDRSSATVKVTCSIDDAAPGVAVSNTCESPTSRAVCQAVMPEGTMPVTICSVAVATFTDNTTASHSNCRTYNPPS